MSKIGSEVLGHIFKTYEQTEYETRLRAWLDDCKRANIITWNRQYPSNVQELSAVRWPTGSGRASYKNNVELFKSLKGLHYNLCDNNGLETSILDCLEKLERVIEAVSVKIITGLPEWEEATTWSC